MKRSLLRVLCTFGLHKHDLLEIDGYPAGPWVTIGKEYIDYCPRCGRANVFTLTRDML
jgi:hypothetical protein